MITLERAALPRRGPSASAARAQNTIATKATIAPAERTAAGGAAL